MEAVERPSWCRRTIVSSSSAYSIVTLSGFFFRYGRVDPLFPLRCAWIRAIGFLGRGCAYRGIVFKIEPVTSETGLRFPDYKGAVISLKRLEVAEVDHFDAGLRHAAFRRLEDLRGRLGDIGLSRPQHEETCATGSYELAVTTRS